MTDRALEGLRIIEFTDEVGPYCGKLLADLGAEVIKVEPPVGGDLRARPPFIRDTPQSPDTSLAFWVWNTSKKSVKLDLDLPADQDKARQLVLSADAYIDDNPPGWLAARGLDYDELRARKPSLVYASITGFGLSGPYSGYAYTDIVGQAMGGVLTLSGDPEDPPQQIFGEQSNMSASVQAAQGTLFALLVAGHSGEGQLVEVSAQEALSMSQETAMQTWDLQKRNRVRTGASGALGFTVPGAGVQECKDGYVFNFSIAPAGEEFSALIDWMREEGMAGDLDEEPYKTLCDNLNYRFLLQMMTDPESVMRLQSQLEHIGEVVDAFFRSMPALHAFEEGQRRRLLIGLVSSPRDIAENRQLRDRHWFTQLEADYLGRSLEWPGAPYRLSETPVVISRPPRLGEHTDQVLGTLGTPAASQ